MRKKINKSLIIQHLSEAYYQVFARTLLKSPEKILKVEYFIVEGSMLYFFQIKEYGICKAILSFKNNHQDKIIPVSKEEFFKEF